VADPAASNPNNPTATDPGAVVEPTEEGSSSEPASSPTKGTQTTGTQKPSAGAMAGGNKS
jgi:hypothetical protein